MEIILPEGTKRPSMPVKDRVFLFVENPITLGLLLLVGGVMGLVYPLFWLIFVVGLMLGLHRSKAVSDQKPLIKVTAYLAVLVVGGLIAYWVNGAVQTLREAPTAIAATPSQATQSQVIQPPVSSAQGAEAPQNSGTAIPIPQPSAATKPPPAKTHPAVRKTSPNNSEPVAKAPVPAIPVPAEQMDMCIAAMLTGQQHPPIPNQGGIALINGCGNDISDIHSVGPGGVLIYNVNGSKIDNVTSGSVSQSSTGDCSPNIIGSGNTTNCGPSAPKMSASRQIQEKTGNESTPWKTQFTISTNVLVQTGDLRLKCSGPALRAGISRVNLAQLVTGNNGHNPNDPAEVIYQLGPEMLSPGEFVTIAVYSKEPVTVISGFLGSQAITF